MRWKVVPAASQSCVAGGMNVQQKDHGVRVLVGGMRQSDWQELEALFKPSGSEQLAVSIERLPDFAGGAGLVEESAARTFQSAPTALCVLGYAAPEEVAAAAMHNGADPLDALERWRLDCKVILSLLEAFPLRTALLHVGAARSHPDLAKGKIGERLEQELDAAGMPPAHVGTLSPLLLAAASYIVSDLGGTDEDMSLLDKVATVPGSLVIRPSAQELALDAIASVVALKEREKLATELVQARNAFEARMADLTEKLGDSERMFAKERAARAALGAELNSIKSSKLGQIFLSLRRIGAHFRQWPRLSRQLRLDVELVSTSEYFDGPWYTERYPDVAAAGVDPALHFVRLGGAEGRAPGPRFCSFAYLASNPDIAERGLNPLVHYLRFGQAEGRTIEPVHDA
ncbi:group 1 glycosyl transferase [Glycocaulis alkaliphilus]|uniref:Group 1 glycosyl transferase n=2 Tax=Glycocaulis alkaliphilus TaxID=1434191 RepID=A0A3T0E7K4_9PROT|nr:group 1 glycosyl transferase [Glycocaulis alkaliphilus]